jgi:hypothetical protein
MDKSVDTSRTQLKAWDMDPSPHSFLTFYTPDTKVGQQILEAMNECEEKMTHAQSVHDKDIAEAKLVMYAKIKKAIDDAK